MIGAVLFGIVADVYGRKKVRDGAHTASDTGWRGAFILHTC